MLPKLDVTGSSPVARSLETAAVLKQSEAPGDPSVPGALFEKQPVMAAKCTSAALASARVACNPRMSRARFAARPGLPDRPVVDFLTDAADGEAYRSWSLQP